MNDYLTFRKMITPAFIQVIFWIAVAAIVIAAFATMANGSVGGGLALLVLGPLAVRIYAEILMVLFRINDNVGALRHAKTSVPSESSSPRAHGGGDEVVTTPY